MNTSTVSNSNRVNEAYQIKENLNNCIEDTADNYIYKHPDHYCIDSDIFKDFLFEVLKERIEETIADFSLNPRQYLKPYHQQQLNEIADEYLAEKDF